eukprot:5229881-Pyramimonas_sp.AAC.1
MHSRSANQDFYAGEALDLMEDLEAGSLVLSSMSATKAGMILTRMECNKRKANLLSMVRPGYPSI